MECFYKDSSKKYKILISILINQNKSKIHSENHKEHSVKFSKDKAIISFIESSPKSNFITITPVNFFTKDDPILRYVPTVRTAQPSSIIWFEGTVFGTKSFDRTDMIDLMFLRYMERCGSGKTAINFIKNTFGRDINDFHIPEQNKKNKLYMKDLFCSVCLLFGCIIHKKHNPKILKYNETVLDCICKNQNMSKHDYMDRTESQKITDSSSLNKEALTNYSLKSCVVAKIAKMMKIDDVDCKKLKKLKLPIKKISSGGDQTDPRQFYNPCDHLQDCKNSKCSCFSDGTLCESFCGCPKCKNLIFCDCKSCGKSCPCLTAGRECTELCKSCTDPSDQCLNSPLLNRINRKVSICKSLKHGLGLFSEEFIPANQFVIEYTGELISDKEAERRGNFYEMNKLSYLFNSSMIGNDCLHSIDAFFIGNKSRFINHSISGANLESKILVSHGNIKIVFYSTKDIYKGDEFLFDYQFTEEHKAKHGIID